MGGQVLPDALHAEAGGDGGGGAGAAAAAGRVAQAVTHWAENRTVCRNSATLLQVLGSAAVAVTLLQQTDAAAVTDCRLAPWIQI